MNLTPKPKRILVIRLSSAGDVVLTSLLIRNLRNRFKRGYLAMLTANPFGEIIEGIDGLDSRYTIPKRGSDYRKTVRELKSERFDTIIDLQNNVRSRKLCSKLNPLRILRYNRPRLNRWQRIHFPWRRKHLKPVDPVAIGYLKIAAQFNVKDDGEGLQLQTLPEWSESTNGLVSTFIEENGLSEGRIIIAAPGAAHGTKVWIKEHWVDFLRKSREIGFQTQILVGSKSDKSLCGDIASGIKHPVLNLAGLTGFGELIALIQRADILASSDSAPMHIAGSVNTPVLALFGATVPEFGFAPLRCENEIAQVEDLKCRPCHKHGFENCPLNHFKCMKDLKPDFVMEKLSALTTRNRKTAVHQAV